MGLTGITSRATDAIARQLTGRTDRMSRRPLVRMGWVILFLLGVMVAVIVQSWRYQVVGAEILNRRSERLTVSSDVVSGDRGTIFDRSGRRILAVTVRDSSVRWDGGSWDDNEVQVTYALAAALDMSPETVFKKIMNAGGRAVDIKKHISDDEEATLRRLDLPSISITSERQRFYPLEQVFGPALGYLAPDPKKTEEFLGMLGVEASYDKDLSPKSRKFAISKDRRNNGYYEGGTGEGWDIDGADLYLNIDARLQFILDSALSGVIKDENATGGMAVMLDPATFKVLAMSSFPSLNPNDYNMVCGKKGAVDDGSNPCRNKVVSYPFEPGSIAKVLGVSAGYESGSVGPQTVVDGGFGHCMIGGRPVSDIKKVGRVTMTEAVKYSSNCAMADMARRVGPGAIADVYARFGVGVGSGIDLPGEARGVLRKNWSYVDAQTAAYGYGFTTTQINLATAFATVVNDGIRLEPRIGREIHYANGRVEPIVSSKSTRVISSETATSVRLATRAVVMEDDGTGKAARPRGFSAGGKTGTARVWGTAKGDGRYNCSFIGYAPADKPRVVVAVTIIEPKVHKFGGVTAGLVFRDVIERALPVLGVQPDMPIVKKPEVSVPFVAQTEEPPVESEDGVPYED
jgi:cell division protein FtsI (penicillin-binding protein 3)